ncbi:MAG TPA: hypothetical protein VLB90_00435 [Pseudomonadales bacterium]|nr:hypothetical protein [Pseudomonadales bacterium]
MKRTFLLLLMFQFSMVGMCKESDSPVEYISKFYRLYLSYNYKKSSDPRPKIDLSKSFSSVVKINEEKCKKYADYPCGWGADGDEYLDAQETDQELTYENSGITISEISPGVVKVELNVYPSIKDAGNFYLKVITYKMVKQSGAWVVDDVVYSDNKSMKQVLTEETKEVERLYNENRAIKQR